MLLIGIGVGVGVYIESADPKAPAILWHNWVGLMMILSIVVEVLIYYGVLPVENHFCDYLVGSSLYILCQIMVTNIHHNVTFGAAMIASLRNR